MALRNTPTKSRIAIWAIAMMFIWQGSMAPPAAGFHTGTRDMHGGTPIGTVTALAGRGTPEPMEPPARNACLVSDGVALHSGEYVYSRDDLVIPGLGLDLAIRHIYASGGNINTRWGHGWFLNYDMRVRKLVNGNIMVLDEQGRKIEYARGAEEEGYIPPPGVYSRIEENADGAFAWTRKTGERYDFDAVGKLTAITDPNGNAIAFAYAEEGPTPVVGHSDFFLDDGTGMVAFTPKLTRVTDTAGREVAFTYNTDGKLTGIKGPGERTVGYAYDAAGNLSRITDAAGRVHTFAYDADHRLLAITDPAEAPLVTNTYDAAGRVQTHARAGIALGFAYDPANHAATVTHPDATPDNAADNPVDYYEFSACCGAPTKVIRDKGGIDAVTIYSYDANNNLVEATDPRGNATRYTYDARGNVTSRTDAKGNTTTFEHDAVYNRLTKVTDSAERSATYTYDANGNLIGIAADGSQGSFTYNADNGALASFTNADNHTTTFTHGDRGYVTGITDAHNATLGLTWDDMGNLTSVTDRNGHATTYAYDADNRIETIKDPLERETRLAYDAAGRMIRRVNPGAAAQDADLTLTYDANGRLTKVRDAEGAVTAYGYDARGRRASITDPLNGLTTFIYDDLGRLTGVTDALNNETHYAYDGNGNLIRVVDAQGHQMEMAYDALDRLDRVTYPDGKTVTRQYDDLGRLLAEKNRANETISYTYDPGRMTKTYPDNTQVAYTYDALSRLKKVVKGDMALEYVYNPLGRVIQEKQTLGGQNYNALYDYDAAGNLVKLTYPDGGHVGYVYDELGRLAAIRDAADQNIATYVYDDAGRPFQMDLANGVRRQFQYDDMDRITRIADTRPAVESQIALVDYAYDLMGNRRSVVNQPAGGHAYGFDDLGRLTSVDYPAGYHFADAQFNYGPTENRLSVIRGGQTISYVANVMDQYTQVGDMAVSHNGIGAITAIGDLEYGYDVENRLRQIKEGMAAFNLKTDDVGRVTGINSATDDTRLVYAFNQVIAEYDGGGNLLRRYIVGPDGPVALWTPDNLRYFYLTDALGSVRRITEASGLVVEIYVYDVYGDVIITNADGTPLAASAIGNPYAFAGFRMTPVADLYLAGSRAYSPILGRYMQPQTPFAPGRTNPYAYAENNPVSGAPAGVYPLLPPAIPPAGFLAPLAGHVQPPPAMGIPLGMEGLAPLTPPVSVVAASPAGGAMTDVVDPNPNPDNRCGIPGEAETVNLPPPIR